MAYRYVTQHLLNKIQETAQAGAPLILEPCEVDVLVEHLEFLENSVVALATEPETGNG